MLQKILLIGVGGSGGKTLRYAHREISRRLEAAGWNEGMPAAWQFLQIDVPQSPDGFESDVPFVLNDPTSYVGLAKFPQDYSTYDDDVTRDAAILPALSGWRPDPKVAYSPPWLGAGQKRGVGRVITLARLNQAVGPLTRCLTSLNTGDAMPQLKRLTRKLGGDVGALDGKKEGRAFVVSSLAGGAGSGAFLDVVQLLRARATASGEWLDQLVTILYAADVFDTLPQAQRPGVEPNTLAALSELVAAYEHTGDIDPVEGHLLARGGGVVHLSNELAGPYNFIVGRSNEALTLPDSFAVFRSTGKALAAFMTNSRVQSEFDSYVIGNWSRPPIQLRIGSHRKDRHPCSSFGFGSVGIGRGLLARYTAERLAKHAVNRLLDGHREGQEPGSRIRDETLIAAIADSEEGTFFDRCQLHERSTGHNQVLDALRDMTAKRAALDTLERDVLRAIGARPAQLKPDKWADIFQTEFLGKTKEFYLAQQADRHERAARWAQGIQGIVVEATAYYVGRTGLPVTLELLNRLKAQLETAIDELERDNVSFQEQERRLLNGAAQVFAHLRDRMMGGQHAAFKEASTKRREHLDQKTEAELYVLAATLMRDLNSRFLPQLRAALASAHSRLAEGRRSEWRQLVDQWPTVAVPKHLEPAPNDVLLEKSESFPAEFDALLRDLFETDHELAARSQAITEIITGAWPARDTTEAPTQNIIVQRLPWGARAQEARQEDEPSAIAQFAVDLDPMLVLDRASHWVTNHRGALSEHMGESLASYLDKRHKDHVLRADRFVDGLAQALRNAAPLVSVNPGTMARVHGGDGSVKHALLMDKIPLAPTDPIYDRVKAVVQEVAKEQPIASFFDPSSTRSEIEISTFMLGSVHPVVFDSLMTPIANEWNARKLNAGGRTNFWQCRRARSLTGFVPLSPGHQKALVRGFWTARLLGMMPPLQGSWNGSPLSVWSPEGQLAFPAYLLGPEPKDDSLLPALMESIGLAFVSMAGGRDSELAAYERLIELGTDVEADDPDLDLYESPNPELLLWISAGKTRTPERGPAAPVPDEAKAGPAKGTPEQRTEALTASLGKLNGWLDSTTTLKLTKTSSTQVKRIWELRYLCRDASEQLASAIKVTDLLENPPF